MKNRLFAIMTAMFILIGTFPLKVSATNTTDTIGVIQFEDGSRIEIVTEAATARVANTVSGSKKYIYRDNNNNIDWEAKLSASFAYAGASYTCSSANCTVTFYDSSWYEVSNTSIRSSNHAIAKLTIGYKTMGVTVNKTDYTITLTCDSNGNLS